MSTKARISQHVFVFFICGPPVSTRARRGRVRPPQRHLLRSLDPPRHPRPRRCQNRRRDPRSRRSVPVPPPTVQARGHTCPRYRRRRPAKKETMAVAKTMPTTTMQAQVRSCCLGQLPRSRCHLKKGRQRRERGGDQNKTGFEIRNNST